MQILQRLTIKGYLGVPGVDKNHWAGTNLPDSKVLEAFPCSLQICQSRLESATLPTKGL